MSLLNGKQLLDKSVENIKLSADGIADDNILKSDNSGDVIWSGLKTVNNQSLFGSGDISVSGGGVIEKTYSELSILKGSNSLIPGQFYKMTDFQTIYDQPDYDASGTVKATVVTKTAPIDPIILLAISDREFALEVWRPSTPLHKLEYNFDYNATRHMGNPTKGRISKCIDEFMNTTYYDHTVVLLKRYESVSGSGVYDSYKDTGFVSVEVLTFQGFSTYNHIGDNAISIILGKPGFIVGNNSFLDGAVSNTLVDYTQNNTFGYSFKNNTFGYGTENNRFGDNTENNTFGHNAKNNILEDEFLNNIIGNYFRSNRFGWGSTNNRFGSDFVSNTFGNDVINNTFVSESIYNIDFTLATHVYGSYNCEIFKRQDGTIRLKYMDNNDAFVITDPTD